MGAKARRVLEVEWWERRFGWDSERLREARSMGAGGLGVGGAAGGAVGVVLGVGGGAVLGGGVGVVVGVGAAVEGLGIGVLE